MEHYIQDNLNKDDITSFYGINTLQGGEVLNMFHAPMLFQQENPEINSIFPNDKDNISTSHQNAFLGNSDDLVKKEASIGSSHRDNNNDSKSGSTPEEYHDSRSKLPETSEISSTDVKKPVVGAKIPLDVVIYLDYTKDSHILTGLALKDIYIDFRLKVLREVEWATWKGKLVHDPRFNKGWTIKKENLKDLIQKLDEYSIPYIMEEKLEEKKKPYTFWSFASEHWEKIKKQVISHNMPPTRANILMFMKKTWSEYQAQNIHK